MLICTVLWHWESIQYTSFWQRCLILNVPFFLLHFEFIFWFSWKGLKRCSDSNRGHCHMLLHCSSSFPKYVISGQFLPFSSSTLCNLAVAMPSWPSISKITFFLFLNNCSHPFSFLSSDRILIKTILSSCINIFPFLDVIKCLLLLQGQKRTFPSWF